MDTREFVEKMNDMKEQEVNNKEQRGRGNPSAKLPTKQHGTQK